MEISKTLKSRRVWLVVGLLVLGIGWRLMPHVANFAPLGAIALLSGVALRGKVAPWVPLTILVISDTIIGYYDSIAWTWLAFMVITLIGVSLRRSKALVQIGLGVPLTALSFFVISNFGTWMTSGMYAHTFAGLVDCYVIALPFFRATILSDVVFGVALLGAYSYAKVTWPLSVQQPESWQLTHR